MTNTITIGPTCAATLAKQQAGLLAATMRHGSPLATLPGWAYQFIREFSSGALGVDDAKRLLVATGTEVMKVAVSLKQQEAQRVVRLFELLAVMVKGAK